jgi:DNA-binding XRE family transcriptional regulator
MARTWQQVKKERPTRGRTDPARVAHFKRQMLDEARAYRLAEVRRAQGETQEGLAKLMAVSQVRVSQIENGDIGRTEVGTLRSYVEALGGRLRIVAEIGNASVTLND